MRALPLFLFVVALAGCSGGSDRKPPAAGNAIVGTVTYREKVALPPEATLVVRLEDVSRADAPAMLLAESRERANGRQVPIPFSLPYDPGRIEPGHTYALRATISDEDELRFTTTTVTPVLSNGVTGGVELVVEPAGAEAASGGVAAGGNTASTATLENTYWKAVRLYDRDIVVTDEIRETHFVLQREGHRVGGNGGCNKLFGTYRVNGDSLLFSGLGGTLMACPEPGMSNERLLNEVLTKTTNYRVVGETLKLLRDGAVIGDFKAVYLE
ncbi:MAG TPA: YbaY family lipoprotein [Candidatus Eisenbacteria bacterium]